MRLAKLWVVAVAVMLTAMIGQANATMLVEMDPATVTITTSTGGSIASGTQHTYYNYSTFATTGSVGFTSLLPVNDRVTVTMYLYADVPDANNLINNYASNPGNLNGDGFATYQAAINGAALPGQTNDDGGAPFVAVGLQNLALGLHQVGGSLALPGSMVATPNSSTFTFQAKPGVSTGAAPNNIGFGTDATNYFYVQKQTNDNNPADPGFSFASYNTTTPSSVSPIVTLITSGGQTYDQLYLGKVTYSFTNTASLVGATAAISALPQGAIGGTNAALWMEDGTVYAGGADQAGDTVGTITATAPVHVTLFGTPVIPEPGTLALLAAGVLALVPTIRRRLCKTA
jgi:hypothetical protein